MSKTFKEVLEDGLEKYPDELVELGENWQLIAKIFYELALLMGMSPRTRQGYNPTSL